jgi:hypothetical protein
MVYVSKPYVKNEEFEREVVRTPTNIVLFTCEWIRISHKLRSVTADAPREGRSSSSVGGTSGLPLEERKFLLRFLEDSGSGIVAGDGYGGRVESER